MWFWRRFMVALGGAAVVLGTGYSIDFVVWKIRMGNGTGMGQVMVTPMTVATLKANKEEYYMDPPVATTCSRSLFPHAEGGACWWLEKHKVVISRY